MEDFICIDCGCTLRDKNRLPNGNFKCPECGNEYTESELEGYRSNIGDEIPDGCEVVTWPKSQYLMEHEDFEELELMPEGLYGPCAYMVDSEWLHENFPNI